MLLLSKDEKKSLYLYTLFSLELIDLIIPLICYFTCGLDLVFYIIFIGVLPLIFSVLEFYPTMDLFLKKRQMKKADFFKIGIYVILLILWISSLFILR